MIIVLQRCERWERCFLNAGAELFQYYVADSCCKKIVPCVHRRKKFRDNNDVNVAKENLQKSREKQFRSEPKKLLERCIAEFPCRTPFVQTPESNGDEDGREHHLRCQAPHARADHRQRDRDHAGDYARWYGNIELRLEVQPSREVHYLDELQRVDHHDEANDTHQGNQARFPIEVGNGVGGEEEESVRQQSEGYVGVEYGGVVGLGGVLFTDKCLQESCFHDGVGQGEKDRYHRDESVVVRRQEAGEKYAYQYAYPPASELFEEDPEDAGSGF